MCGGSLIISQERKSGTDMTGRPGYRTMEMIGGSSAPYLARTPCVPLFCTSFNRVGNKERFRLPGAGGGSFPLYGGTFARSYSVSRKISPKGSFWDGHLPQGPRRTKNLLRVVFLLCRPVIYYRGAPCADTTFLGITDIFPLREGSVS